VTTTATETATAAAVSSTRPHCSGHTAGRLGANDLRRRRLHIDVTLALAGAGRGRFPVEPGRRTGRALSDA
jgi:hypothetical protein